MCHFGDGGTASKFIGWSLEQIRQLPPFLFSDQRGMLVLVDLTPLLIPALARLQIKLLADVAADHRIDKPGL